jgi:hypothetical protein
MAFGLVFVPCLVMAQGNLVFNGSFDSGAAGWTLANGAHLIPGISVDLYNSSPSLSVLPTASQTINSLTPAVTYIVSGDYLMEKDQMPGGSPLEPSFGVFIDNVIYFQYVSSENFGWQSFSFLYTATASSADLSFSSYLNGTEIPYAIDNIAMNVVPEPSASWLIMIDSGVLIYLRRNRKHSCS